MKNQRIAIAGDAITIPENTKVIIEGGVVIFESKEKPALKVGEWYTKDGRVCLKISEYDGKKSNAVGFGIFGIDRKWSDYMTIFHEGWKPVDMQKVKKLLIGEAEKRGFKKGVTAKVNNNARKLTSDPYTNTNGILANDNEIGWVMLFDSKTGKWAEIIREPLYTNQYGTEFFEGDEYWYVNSKNLISYCDSMRFGNMKHCTGNKFRGTKKECYQYLADNCKE